jgi:hypothetical protein
MSSCQASHHCASITPASHLLVLALVCLNLVPAGVCLGHHQRLPVKPLHRPAGTPAAASITLASDGSCLLLQVFASAITNVLLSGLTTGQLARLLPPASHSFLLALVCFNLVPAGLHFSHYQRLPVRPVTILQASHPLCARTLLHLLPCRSSVQPSPTSSCQASQQVSWRAC